MKAVVAIEQDIVSKLQKLSRERKLEVLDFLDFLGKKQMPKRSLRSLKGLWADLGVHTTEDDIVGARREMWGSFPRTSI